MNQITNWLDNIPSQVVGSYGYCNSKTVKWIIERLGSKYESSFKEAASDLGYNIGGKEMDQVMADSMWEEANVGSAAQRTIMRYLRGYFRR
eukprot:CAMPEP_0184872686 /NCGR_PEP_ID=MMETSP0580-20130426/41430_1 /TAXON_ID=1118495 /ORGANISM="Dactyliosolen fragilissimus" /LENGTH=90 /DNA_ID=CAMNT_0027375517 /DNA_START=979 /DNA_END=1248 /DNA_ORIENTATION=+